LRSCSAGFKTRKCKFSSFLDRSRADHAGPEAATLLGRLVEVLDIRSGDVRLRQDVVDVDAEMANVRSVRTIRITG
jgi:hypothetical protein